MTDDIITGKSFAIDPPPNPWKRISEIAGKLGVKPTDHSRGASVVATGADGETYDVWEVVSALIDRMAQKAEDLDVGTREKDQRDI